MSCRIEFAGISLLDVLDGVLTFSKDIPEVVVEAMGHSTLDSSDAHELPSLHLGSKLDFAKRLSSALILEVDLLAFACVVICKVECFMWLLGGM